MKLILHQELLAICQLHPTIPIPEWLPDHGFCSLTRTSKELSIVCLQSVLPAHQQAEKNWQALEIEGPLAFSETGILAALAEVLACAAISIFVVSTYETDFILVREKQCQHALTVLRDAGHKIT